MSAVSLPTYPLQLSSRWQAVWNLIRPELLPLFRALTEIALLTPLAIRFMPWARLWPPAALSAWLLLLMLVPYFVERFLTLVGVSPGRRRVLLLLGALLAVILNVRLLLYDPPGAFSLAWLGDIYARLIAPENPAFQQDISVVIFAGVAWWRGMTLTGRSTDSQRTGRYFRLGVLALLPLIILLSGPRLRLVVTPYVLLFFVGSLMTMALTRAHQVESGESGSAFPVTPGWVVRVLGPSVALVLVTGIFTGLLTGQQISGLLGWLSPLWLAVSITLNTVLAVLFRATTPLIALFERLFALFQRLFTFSPIPVATPAATPDPNAPPPTPAPETGVDLIFDPATAELILQIAGIILVVVVLALVIYVSYRSQRQLDAGRELITGTRARAAETGRSAPGRGAGWLDNLRQWRKLRAAATIRRIYENMLIIAAQNGFARSAVETPLEYTATLDQVWPAHQAEINRITQAYIRVRYGELPETRAEFDAIHAAWETLRRTPPMRRTEDGATEDT